MKMKQLSHFVICVLTMIFAPILDITPGASAAPPRRVDAVKEANPMPEFPGGQEAFEKFINDNFKFPTKEIHRKQYEGANIEIRLIVMSDGTLGPYSLFLDSTRPGLDFKDLRRVLEELPKFKPGKVNGKPVNVQITMPVTIYPPLLEETETM